MRTEKQIAASRANGARSGGRGVRAVDSASANYKMLARVILFEGESSRGFQQLVSEVTGCLKPESPIEHLLIGRMVAAHWRQVRLWAKEQKENTYLGLEENRLDRQFYRAFDRIFKLRAPSVAPESVSDSSASVYPNEKGMG